MHSTGAIQLVDSFPNFRKPGFDIRSYNKMFTKSNIIIHASAKEVAYDPHWGPLSIKCAFNGNEYYEFNRCRYRVDDSGFLLLNEGQVYSSYIHSATPVESFTINFTADYIANAYSGWLRNACPGEEGTDMPLFCERLYNHHPPVSQYIFLLKKLTGRFGAEQARIEECFLLLLHALFGLHRRQQAEVEKVRAVKSSTQRELHQRLMRARDYIESCYAEDISLEKLAAASCLNPSYLLRQFKQYFGVSPRQYAIRKRMSAAADLLKHSDATVTAVCYLCGYQDLTSFCKLFRQFYRASPQEYRWQHCAKKSIFT